MRVLPWLLDPLVPWRVAVPFGRAVASVAVEAAVLVGWPVGWALATFALCERGEARVLATLGERPLRTTSRLFPMALLFGAIVGAASLAGGRDASEPGPGLYDLRRPGPASCAGARAPRAFDGPYVGAAWLCGAAPGGQPLLAGRPPFASAGERSLLYTARSIDVTPDARRIELDGASLATRASTLRAAHAVFLLPTFVRASSLPAEWRAVFLAAAGVTSGLIAVWILLLMEERGLGHWRLHAIALGAAGPVACLALLHALERAERYVKLCPVYASLPIAAGAAPYSSSLSLCGACRGVRAAARK